jgi:radical SAM-linked protein
MSEGFHPKPRVSFPSALAVGIEAVDEVLELELAAAWEGPELLARLAPLAPTGLGIRSAEVLPPGVPKAQVRSLRYAMPVPAAHAAGLAERIARLRSSSSWPVQRPNRPTPVDLCASLEEVALEGERLTMCLRTDRQATAGPREVLDALGLSDLEREGHWLTRTAVELTP